MLKVAFSMLMALMISACAVGNKVEYSSQSPQLTASTPQTVVVGAQDQRTYVAAGQKPPTFVGVTRGAYGDPFDANTKSGQPLADDFSAAIANGLKEKKIAVETVVISASDTREQAIKILLEKKKQRALFLTINEWRSDQYVNTAVNISLKAEVLDSAGTVLATNTVQDRREIKGSWFDFDPYSTAAPKAVAMAQQVVEQLLNDPKIVDALK